MKINNKFIAGLGTIALSLMTLTCSSAQVSTTPSAGLTLAFDTDGSTQTSSVDSTGTVTSRGLGVGFDSSNFDSQFTNSSTAATAQSVYNPLITDSSAAGGFSTIGAGSSFQLGLHAYGINRANTTLPITEYVSLYAYNPNAAAGAVPTTGSAIFSALPVNILDTADSIDHTYFSSVITLANPIVANTEYVLAVDGGTSGGATPTNFGTVDRSNFTTSGLPSADASIYRQYFLVDNNSGDLGGAYTLKASGGITQPLGYSFYASSAAVPEASSLCSFGGLLVLGGLILVRRRVAQ